MATISYLEKPHFVSVINAPSGLYAQVLVKGKCSEDDLLEFVRKDVAANGYRPDGRGRLGGGSEYGIGTRSFAMWFYDKEKS